MRSTEEDQKPHLNEKASFEGRESFLELRDSHSPIPTQIQDFNTKLENPLARVPHKQLLGDAIEFAKTHDLAQYAETIQKGALVAQNPAGFETISMLTEDDKRVLRREYTHKWDQPKTLYYLVILCSIAAAVGGVRLY